jgi:hypothetical protein
MTQPHLAVYDAAMRFHWTILAAVSLVLILPACKKPAYKQPVVVHLFRDLYSPYAHELDHRILDFQASNPKLPSGAPIVLESIHEAEYKSALKGNFEANVKVEILILNAASDVAGNASLTADLAHAVDICAGVKACPTNVPAFVLPSATGDQAAAAAVFLNYLAQHK